MRRFGSSLIAVAIIGSTSLTQLELCAWRTCCYKSLTVFWLEPQSGPLDPDAHGGCDADPGITVRETTVRRDFARLHRFELHHEAIGQFAHPSDEIAIHIGHP